MFPFNEPVLVPPETKRVSVSTEPGISQFLFSGIIKAPPRDRLQDLFFQAIALRRVQALLLVRHAISNEPRPSTGSFYYSVDTWPAITSAPFRSHGSLRDGGTCKGFSFFASNPQSLSPILACRFIEIEMLLYFYLPPYRRFSWNYLRYGGKIESCCMRVIVKLNYQSEI